MKPTRISSACATKLLIVADPTRLAVVEEISRYLGVARNLLWRHLRILREAEIVTSCRDGQGVKYGLTNGTEVGSSHHGISLGFCCLKFTNLQA